MTIMSDKYVDVDGDKDVDRRVGLSTIRCMTNFADVVVRRLGPLVDFDNDDDLYYAFHEWVALYHSKLSDDLVIYWTEIGEGMWV
jgi:hypothetical protein